MESFSRVMTDLVTILEVYSKNFLAEGGAGMIARNENKID